MKSITKKDIFQSLGVGALAAAPSVALANAGGFANTASTMLNNMVDGIVIIIGVIAIIALIWQLAEGFMGRKTWPEVLSTSIWIVAAGAAPALAKWLFASGKSMTFA